MPFCMRRFLALAGLACGLATFGASDDAQACGGCFVGGGENTIVTGHRMALSISQDRTVLWDQIQYTGDASDFSWVLPVKPGAVLEVANDAWFDVLEAATTTNVAGRPAQCFGNFDGGFENGMREDSSGFGCGSDMALDAPAAMGGGSTGSGGELSPPPDPVEVVSEGSAGPYDMVTLSTDVPGALNEWLDANGYEVPDEMQPVIDAYVAEGFDFIALRLSPDSAVSQMKPVRVITPGSSFALPLKMVAAGTGANTALTLFMIGEGRYQARNFENAFVTPEQVSWDYDASRSSYSDLRLDLLAQNDGRTWLTSYARSDSLFGQVQDEIAMAPLTYQVGGVGAPTIADAYVHQGVANGEGDTTQCLNAFDLVAGSMDVVVDDICADDEERDNGDCTPAEPGQIAASTLACGNLDDVATALVGMHPADVWITRMEANLPRAALDADLLLEAADTQNVVENRFFAVQSENHPCPEQAGALRFGKPKGPTFPGGPIPLVLGAAALGFVLRRRRRTSAEAVEAC